ncbi:lipocalin family protein [Formosa sp. PL04]|uniref:lipocalin family protein n=1 Tax=Formosa sp. PL04 TaxID=3081755 RepID=UPI00298182CE|nr:lipocalin family protein [Formosa sp. PL04]MDW5288436.1 lipocalin family protein [Formosa sp. PL04]
MKKFIYLTLAILVFSCSSSKSTTAPQPSKKMLKGSWEVTNIKFIGDKGLYKAYLFDLADSSCFKGGEWVFIPNNGSGKFSTNPNSSICEAYTNSIHWSFLESGDGFTQFQFKYVGDDIKAKNVKSGYVATIQEISDNIMVIKVPSEYEGNPFDVIMTFNKTSDSIDL